MNYTVDPKTGCWLFNGRFSKGYGIIELNGRSKLAHRAMYELEIGPLPSKIQLDHLCRRRNCINPAHLEPVTNRENTKRIFSRYRRSLKACPEGHNLEEHGIPTPEGGIVCSICSGVTHV